jgi:4-amino-4-deoxy-L-arabinose transferase-like glycosyltransferase
VSATEGKLNEGRAWRLALSATMLLTGLRLLVLFASPLDLYPDEAQYWLWSRTLDLGYYSKPPMIAWIIHLTTLLGNAEPFVRLAAPLLHAGTGLALFAVGRRLYGAWAGLFALLVYHLMPGVVVSSGIISTDAPLLFFLSLALLAYVDLPRAKRPLASAAALGAALGLAMLSKYAALYAVVAIVIHLALDREARRAWTLRAALTAIGMFGLMLAPNLAWNVLNGFETIEHTASNADVGSGLRFDLVEMVRLVIEQFGVFGLFFAVLLAAAVLAFRRRLERADLLLLCWTAPPILAVTVQAFLTRANANWTAAAYVAGAVLAAGLLMRWKAKWPLIGGLALQAGFAGLFMVWVVSPRTAEAMGAANSFKRVKGWEVMSEAVVRRAEIEMADRDLSAIAVDDRFLFNSLAYYGRNFFKRPGAPPLKIWLRRNHAGNQAEARSPLTPEQGERVLLVTAAELKDDQDGGRRMQPRIDLISADFAASKTLEVSRARLDAKRVRRTVLILGENYKPRQKD